MSGSGFYFEVFPSSNSDWHRDLHRLIVEITGGRMTEYDADRQRRMPGVRQTVEAVIVKSGAVDLAMRAARHRVPILTYHDPDIDTFADHMDALRRRGAAFIPLDSLVDSIRSGDWSGVPSRAMVVTFDDGWKGNASLAPIFAEHRVRPVIFLCSQVVATNRHYWWTTSTRPRGVETPPPRRTTRRAPRGDGPRG